jgi:imidazolonepropionase
MITLIVNKKNYYRFGKQYKVCGAEMAILPTIKNAFLVINDHLIADFGSMDHLPKINADKTIDATGKWFYPLDVTVIHILFMLVTANKNL